MNSRKLKKRVIALEKHDVTQDAGIGGGSGGGDFKADGSVSMTGNIDMDGHDILGVGTIRMGTVDLGSQGVQIGLFDIAQSDWYIGDVNGLLDSLYFQKRDGEFAMNAPLAVSGPIKGNDNNSSFEGNVLKAVNEANSERGAPLLLRSGEQGAADEGGPITLWTGGAIDGTSGYIQFVSKGIKIFDNDVTGHMAIMHPAVFTTYAVTLPAAQGAGPLVNNGSGALSWGGAMTGITSVESVGADLAIKGDGGLTLGAGGTTNVEGPRMRINFGGGTEIGSGFAGAAGDGADPALHVLTVDAATGNETVFQVSDGTAGEIIQAKHNKIVMYKPVVLPVYANAAALPSAVTMGQGAFVYLVDSDGAGTTGVAYSDGTTWQVLNGSPI